MCPVIRYFFFFFNDTATTEIYTLSLHDALPISQVQLRLGGEHDAVGQHRHGDVLDVVGGDEAAAGDRGQRSEEHTSELQSRQYLVCRLLLEKKTTTNLHYQTLHPILNRRHYCPA